MQKLRFVNGNGVELDLTSGHYGITNWSGFSNADLTIQGQQVPFQDGEVFLDALYNPRELSVTLAINDNNNLALRYELKRELISVMNAKLGEGYLYYKNDYLERRIKVIPQLPVFENKNSNDSGTLKASLSWTAPEVYWEDVEETMVSLKSFEEKSIVNNGDVPCAVKIEVVTGNTPGYSIQNDDKILSLQEIQDYDRLKINTELGQKNVSGGDFIYNYNKARVLFSETASCPDFTLCVCDRGVVIKILNNGDFKTVYTGTTEDLHSICYSEDLNIFVIVGNRNTILTSTDGETWTQRTITNPVTNAHLFKVVYIPKKHIFVIGGGSGSNVWLTSDDAVNWTVRGNSQGPHYGICYNSKLDKIYMTCASGVLSVNLGETYVYAGVSVELHNICYSKNKDIMVLVGASGTILTSTDGETWTQRTSPVNSLLRGVCYSEELGIFIICGGYGNNHVILTSTNGISWNGISGLLAVNYYSVFFNNYQGQFFVSGNFGTLLKSRDGSNWNTILTGVDVLGNLGTIIFSQTYKKWIISSSGITAVFESSDGWNWERTTLDSGSTYLSSICENQNVLLGVGNSGVIIKSENNFIWNLQTSGVSANLKHVIFDGNKYITVGASGTILTSTDGETWNQRTSPVNEDLNEVFYSVDKGIYIITGNNGTILTSTDGETWNQRTSPVVTHLNSATFNLECNIFAIVGEGQVVLTSEDAITWNKLQVFDTSKSFVKIKYFPECSPTTWIVGEGGTVYTTSDFVVFGKKDVYINEWYNDVIYSNTDDKLILCGNNGLIAQYSANFKNNIVNKLSFNSNMNFILTPGENTLFVYNVSHPVYSTLTYRQRYIGV